MFPCIIRSLTWLVNVPIESKICHFFPGISRVFVVQVPWIMQPLTLILFERWTWNHNIRSILFSLVVQSSIKIIVYVPDKLHFHLLWLLHDCNIMIIIIFMRFRNDPFSMLHASMCLRSTIELLSDTDPYPAFLAYLVRFSKLCNRILILLIIWRAVVIFLVDRYMYDFGWTTWTRQIRVMPRVLLVRQESILLLIVRGHERRIIIVLWWIILLKVPK